nr:MAG TPA: tail protein [Caudoviricetes sp.]
MIKIYDINDKLLMQAEVTSAAKREQEMSKSDYISLSFSAAEKVILPVGAYINYTYKIDKVREVTRKFLLLESYEPTQSDECSWKYTPQFQHPKMILSKTPFFIYTRNSQNVEVKQNVWSFVGITSVLSEKIKDFLNKDLMFGECGWKVIFSNVTANTVNVSFSDNDFISALTAITNAIGDNCEWHIDYDDEIIYIGKVLIGATPVVLEVGKNVGVPSINNSKEGYYNAFSIFGGTRNITQVNSKGENVSSGDIRLQLDEGNGTILIDGKERSYSIDKYSTLDLRADKTKEPLFTKVLDFSQIFPSLNTYVYNVRGRVKYVLDEKNNKIPISNADGSVKGYKTFTVWYMRLAYPTTEKVAGKKIINTTIDDGITHYWYDFEVTDDLLINGKNIGCSFEPNFNTGALSTPLAGQGTNGEYVGFELTYHKEASSSHTSDDVSKDNFSVLAGDYEIIYQQDNEVIIPTNKEEMLIPRGENKPSLKCNITVLYNIAMANTIYYEDAQNRLLEKAKEEIVRLLSDLNNYEVKSYSDVFLEENPQLQIGQSVTYKDGHGYELATRVLKLSTNIDYDFIQSITLGNQAIKGTITQLKEDVQTIIANGGNSGNGGGFSVSQLRSLIAKYGSDNFISKQFDDIAHGTITWEKIQKFIKGLNIGDGNNYSIDSNGNAILSSVLVNLLKSLDFNEAEQSGFAIKQRSDGKFQMLLTDLIVWGKAIFNTLLIRELSYVGGNIVLSPAAGKISYTKEVFSETTNELIGWKCYLLADDGTTATINSFKVDDQVRCKTFNIKAGVYENVSNKDYWRLVTKVSTENEVITDAEGHELYDGKKFAWIQIAKDNCMEGSDNPAAGDTIVLMGNRSDTSRQHLLMMETEGDSAPRFTMYRGINSYSLKDKSIFDVSFDGVSIVSKFFQLVNVSGEKVWTPIYLGDWKEGTEYSYYDEVTWMGTRWLCIVSEGQTTTAEPSEDSPYWKATTAIQRNKLLIDLRGQDTLDWGETIDVVCSVVLGEEVVDTSSGWDWSVERDSGNKQEDAAWNASSKAQNFKGTINIAFTENENDLGAENKNTFGVVFTFKAWQIGNKTNEVSATLSV